MTCAPNMGCGVEYYDFNSYDLAWYECVHRNMDNLVWNMGYCNLCNFNLSMTMEFLVFYFLKNIVYNELIVPNDMSHLLNKLFMSNDMSHLLNGWLFMSCHVTQQIY